VAHTSSYRFNPLPQQYDQKQEVLAMTRTVGKLTLQEFLALPESDEGFEFVDGELKPKVSPKFQHSKAQLRLLTFIHDWCEQQQSGRVLPEWAVVLQRRGRDWVPVPDLLYVSFERLPQTWEEDEPCPVVPELVIEIISPGQTFAELTEKATDYLIAGVDRVWVVDTKAQVLTIFRRDALPDTLRVEDSVEDPLLPGLALPIARLFSNPAPGN
jgi:Uma2 family endonuclease